MIERQLLGMKLNLDCANETEATVLGVFFAKTSGRSILTGEETTARSLVYVIKGRVCLLSKSTLMALGCLHRNFPEVGRFLPEVSLMAMGCWQN